ncbi:hypothetical protein K525DRAFT_259895 [Schizophyllum commune Loenen D]|nr:hypothetical protein K525DRAFT_259895 [Schizophyllum commune Loenen D]
MTENKLERLITETNALANGSAFSSGYPSLHDTQIMQAQTARLDEEIERTEARLAEARRVRDLSKALVAPIRRLPPELLSEVFLLATPATWYDECSGDRMQDIRWRAIALGTHALWNTIKVVVEEESASESEDEDEDEDDSGSEDRHDAVSKSERNQRWDRIVDVWLARSGGALLNITFLNGLGDDAVDVGVSAWKRLVAECHRWRTVHVQAPYEFYEGLEDLHFPALVNIHLSAGGWDEEALTHPHPVPAFTHAPNMRRLTCEDVRVQYWFPDVLPSVPESWKPSTVHAAAYPITLCAESVETCLMMLTCTPYHFDPPQTRTRMSRLKTLGTANRGCELLYYIDAPALTTLHMMTRGSTYREGIYADQMACLKAMLLRDSSMRLESLLLTDISANCRDIIGCLELLPSLGQFSLERIRLGRNGPFDIIPLLRKLTRDNSRPESLIFLPHLGNLTLSWRTAYDRLERELCMPLLTDMVISRLEDIDAEEYHEGLYDFETNLDPDLTLDDIVDIAWERKK